MGAFTKLFQRLRLTADANVTTQTTTVIQTDTTNSSIALVPNGTGAIIASVPDGTATGGNARGTNAVDLQITRTANTNVASGTNSIIGGGASNTSSSNYSTISGGQSNTASTNTHATVVGGQSNTASGLLCIAGGYSNVSSNQGTIAIGQVNNASGYSSVAIGYNNNASGSSGIAVGNSNQATANYSFASGIGSVAYLQGQLSKSSGQFSAVGDAQQSLLTAKRSASLTTGATTILSLDGTGTTNIIIPNGNNRAWNVQIDTIAVVTAITGTATGVSVGDCYMEKACLLFKRVGGTSSIVGSPDVTSIKSDASMATAGIDINAGSSQQLEIVFNAPSFSGGGSVTFRIVSKVSLVEVAY